MPLSSSDGQTETSVSDAVKARRNIHLGLLIGGLCLVQIVVFMIIFSRNGLPKDPKIWKEQKARQAQQSETDRTGKQGLP